MKNLNLVLAMLHAGRSDQAVPLGAACVASALKADPELSPHLTIALQEGNVGDDPLQFARKIASGAPDIVGFSLYTWNRAATLDCARALASLLPNAFLFCGGPEAGALSVGLAVSEGGPFRLVIRGEGELVAREALRPLFFNASVPPSIEVETPPAGAPADLAGLPSPWLDGTLACAGREGVLWELARGCPYACAYCYESKGDRRIRYIDSGRMEAELDLFVREKVPVVHVLDPTFNANPERSVELLDRLERAGKDIHWHFEIRAENLTRAQAKRFSRLGASLQIGLQSADEEVCARVGRKLKRGLFASKIALLNEEGASFGLDLIWGLPGDRLSGYCASVDYALGLYPDSLDMFPLAVLPGTELADRATEWKLEYDREAPYLIRSTPNFPPADIAKARRLSQATDLFYNQGRAVGWFNQVLYPLGDKPSRFLEGFADFLKLGKDGTPQNAPLWDPDDPVGLERLQLEYLDLRYEDADLAALLPAVWDVVRFNGAWSRALAEGISTNIEFNYDPDEVLGESAMDLEEFVSLAQRSPRWARVEVGEDGPRLVLA